MLRILGLACLMGLAGSTAAQACSAFRLARGGVALLGFNENWKHMPGMVLVSPRGLEKRGLVWPGVPGPLPEGPRWTSKHGSVTFSVLGADLPCYGLNEAGLFAVELFLDDTFSLPQDPRPRLFWAHWIQYQLDQFATVEEVVAHLPDMAIDWWPTFPGSHFFFADRAGHTAVLELIKGKPVIHAGAAMPFQALCNRPYAQEVEALKAYRAFGGTRAFKAEALKWSERGSLIAHRQQEFAAGNQDPLPFAWKLLEETRPGTWQLVVDQPQATLHFRSAANAEIKSLDLRKLDFSAGQPIRFLDLHLNQPGAVESFLAPWSPEVNRAYVLAGFPAAYEAPDFYRSKGYPALLEHLKTHAEALERQIKHP